MLVALLTLSQLTTGCFSITSKDGSRTTRFTMGPEIHATVITHDHSYGYYTYDRVWVPYSSQSYWIADTKRMYGFGGGHGGGKTVTKYVNNGLIVINSQSSSGSYSSSGGNHSGNRTSFSNKGTIVVNGQSSGFSSGGGRSNNKRH